MNHHPELIVMLTYHDRTVENALQIFEQCKNSKANFWGLKHEGLAFEQMKELFSAMKRCGKTTVLEVVAYTEKQCMQGARMAVECECNILMGTVFFDSVNTYCKNNGIKYMPFVGTITGCPSVLGGTADEMIAQANRYLEKGVFGFDLLGYRHSGDAAALNKEFVSRVQAPVCLAGNINSYQRLDEVKNIAAWAFTIGGAFFERKFGKTFLEQIDNVCTYIEAFKTHDI